MTPALVSAAAAGAVAVFIAFVFAMLILMPQVAKLFARRDEARRALLAIARREDVRAHVAWLQVALATRPAWHFGRRLHAEMVRVVNATEVVR